MKSDSLISRLLMRNLSKAQLAGFVLSNFIGLAIVITGIQFYADVRSIWEDEDSFINQDYLVVNKKVTAANTLGGADSGFTPGEITDLEAQPWERRVGQFKSADYEVKASVDQGGRSLYTNMFFESVPDEFIDIEPADWRFDERSGEVPVIISKDYLTLYNFGFASSSGMPQLTEGMLSAIPLRLQLTSRDGTKRKEMQGRIVGFSGRLNTILVPDAFMKWSNSELGVRGKEPAPYRLIVDVSSPGDVAIGEYLEAHGLERAGEDGGQAAFFLKLVSGLVIGIGGIITLLSFFILLLSVALLMQKNREKLHLLIMLGFDLRYVSKPYCRITVWVSVASYIMAVIAMLVFRNIYIRGVAGLSGGGDAGVWLSLVCGAALAALTVLFNVISIKKKVKSAFYN